MSLKFEVRTADDKILASGRLKQKLTGPLIVTLKGGSRALFDGTPSDLWIVDQDGNIRSCNKWEDVVNSVEEVKRGEVMGFNIDFAVNLPGSRTGPKN